LAPNIYSVFLGIAGCYGKKRTVTAKVKIPKDVGNRKRASIHGPDKSSSRARDELTWANSLQLGDLPVFGNLDYFPVVLSEFGLDEWFALNASSEDGWLDRSSFNESSPVGQSYDLWVFSSGGFSELALIKLDVNPRLGQ
jgi:hypothetical protein